MRCARSIDYRPETLAWNVTANALHVVRERQAATLPFDALMVCAGATDRLMPVPGWHRAGCYSLGAAQIALKAQACAIGARTVFLGSGPLLYLVGGAIRCRPAPAWRRCSTPRPPPRPWARDCAACSRGPAGAARPGA